MINRKILPVSLLSPRPVLLLLTPILLLLAACGGAPPAAPQNQAVPVTLGKAERRTVPVQVKAIGHVEPYSTVTVKSLVGGELQKIYFKEGQTVRKGEPLFLIDSKPYQNVLDQARAQWERDKALSAVAAEDVARYSELVKKDYVTQEQYNQTLANAKALESSVKADEAAVQNAALNLGYCAIASPIDGRTGALIVHEGNLVKANADTGLVVILQIKPIFVSFTIPEQYLTQVRENGTLRSLPVDALVPGAAAPVTGSLNFVDNAVDNTTGTIFLKGLFANDTEVLWPGQYVNTVLTLSRMENAVVIPSEAIQASQQGTFVYIVKSDSTVELKMVKRAFSLGGTSVLSEGLNGDETVVTDGQLRLVPGSKVEVAQGLQTNK